jgi:hypothetical protein
MILGIIPSHLVAIVVGIYLFLTTHPSSVTIVRQSLSGREPQKLMTSRESFCNQFACFRKPISCVVVESFRVGNCMLLLRE